MGNPRRALDISVCAKPTIGMMNGLAYGGAAVLASALDIRVGCESSRFRFLAAAYGRINATWSLGSQIGWPQAKELLFTGARRRGRRRPIASVFSITWSPKRSYAPRRCRWRKR
jgi:enoyl-CoA hydratase/carnithine racemase